MLLVTQVRMRGTGPQATLDDSGLDELARSFTAPGVAVLSMKETLSGKEFAPLFLDNAHLRPQGHLVLARAILDAAEGAGLMPMPAR